MSLVKKRVLVTGGAGFIGSHLVDALIAEGCKVAVVDDLSTGFLENVNKSAQFYQMDVASDELAPLMKSFMPDTVYHLASNTNVPMSIQQPVEDLQSLNGALNVIDLCRLNETRRFVFTSSGFIYGNTMKRPICETEPFQPISPYAISKKAVEHYLQFYREVYGLEYVVLRFSTVYGPRQRHGAMADYIRKLSQGQQAEIYGDGTKTRDYVYVADVVELLARVAIVDLPNVDPVFNISSAVETTLNDVYFTIAGHLQREAKPIYLPDRPGELEGYSLDYTKARDSLGWNPRCHLREGLQRTLQYWME